MSRGATAKTQAQPSLVTYPMIGFPAKSSSNNWGGLLQEIRTNKFDKYLEANDQDTFYYNFLTENPKPTITKNKELAKMLSDSQLTEEQKEGKKLLLEGVRHIVSNSKKRQQTHRKTENGVKFPEVESVATDRASTVAFADFRSMRARKRAPSFEKLNIYPNPPTLDELGIVLQRKEEECYVLKNLTNQRLYVLVLKLMVEQFKLSPKRFTRRKSATDLESGGECRKLSGLTGAEDEETLYKDLLTLHYGQQQQLLQSREWGYPDRNQLEGKQGLECPWYLDPNPLSLSDSLEGLKQALTKLATEKEAVVYKYYSANGNLLPHANRFDPSLGTDPSTRSPEGVRSIGSPSKFKNLPKDRRISPMSRKESGTFKFIFAPEQLRGSNRSINMGSSEPQRKNSIMFANNADNPTASKSNFRPSKQGFSLNGFKESEEELLLMDKVREILNFASSLCAPSPPKNILANLSASGQSLPKHDSVRLISDTENPVTERRKSDFAPRKAVQRSGPVKYSLDPREENWEGPEAAFPMVSTQKPQGGAPLLKLTREPSANKSASMLNDQSLLDKSVSRKDTGPSHLKHEESESRIQESRLGNGVSLDDTHVELSPCDRMYKAIMDQFGVKISPKIRSRLQRAVKVSKQLQQTPSKQAEKLDMIENSMHGIPDLMSSQRDKNSKKPPAGTEKANLKVKNFLEKALLRAHERQRIRIRQSYIAPHRMNSSLVNSEYWYPELNTRLQISLQNKVLPESGQNLTISRNPSQESVKIELGVQSRHMAPVSPYLNSGKRTLQKLGFHKRSTSMVSSLPTASGLSPNQKQDHSSACKLSRRKDDSSKNSFETGHFRILSSDRRLQLERSHSQRSKEAQSSRFKPTSFAVIPMEEYSPTPFLLKHRSDCSYNPEQPSNNIYKSDANRDTQPDVLPITLGDLETVERPLQIIRPSVVSGELTPKFGLKSPYLKQNHSRLVKRHSKAKLGAAAESDV